MSLLSSRCRRPGAISRVVAPSSSFSTSMISPRPLRSVLYVPASNARALDKLDTLVGRARPDAVMFDLEDGVSPDGKGKAREALFRRLSGTREGEGTTTKTTHRRFDLLRINRADTPWFEDDASMAHALTTSGSIDGVVLPKIEGGEDVDRASRHFLGLHSTTTTITTISPVPLWAMVETPRAVLSSSDIACRPSVHGLILGTNDLGKELRLRRRRRFPTTTDDHHSDDADHRHHRGGLSTSLQFAILAARAHGKVVIDGVYNDTRDEVGFREECARGMEWGMDGKTLIHPDQVPWTNEIFAPSDEEVEYATRVVRCWDDAAATGSEGRAFTGVAVLDGMMIESLHVDVARRLLQQADIIKSME